MVHYRIYCSGNAERFKPLIITVHLELLFLHTLDLPEVTSQSPSSSTSTIQPSNHESKQRSMTYAEFRNRKESTRVTSLPSASAKKSKSGNLEAGKLKK